MENELKYLSDNFIMEQYRYFKTIRKSLSFRIDHDINAIGTVEKAIRIYAKRM